MKVIPLFELPPDTLSTSVALGYFDGIHLGHQKLLKSTVLEAHRSGRKSAVFTFLSHPLKIIAPERAPYKLTSFMERTMLFELMGLDYFIWTDFDEEFRDMSPEAYVEEVLIQKMGAKSVFIGPNYHFGKRARGTPEMLDNIGKERGFMVNVIDPVYTEKEMVSSTLLRKNLFAGKVDEACRLLGRYYNIPGKVTRTRKLRETTGLSLYHMKYSPERVTPGTGIYAGYIHGEGTLCPALIYTYPSHDGKRHFISCIPLEQNHNLIGKDITLLFVERIRDMGVPYPLCDLLSLSGDIDAALDATRGTMKYMDTSLALSSCAL